MSFKTHPKLYQVDAKGKLRFWRMETEDGKHRTVSGIVGGREVVSGWVTCEAKNEGRSNATSPEEQAELEVVADYKLKADRKYYSTPEEAQEAGFGTKFLQPMLAEKWGALKDKIPVNEALYVQPKLDGIRAVVTKDGIFSRAGKPIVAVPHISEALEEFFHAFPHVVLDGELYNHDLKEDFNKITSLVKKGKPTLVDLQESEDVVQFHCYDVMIDSKLPLPFKDRIWFRDENLDRTWCVRHVETVLCMTRDEVDLHYARWLEEGYEGQMVRRNSPYENRRSKSLMKRKEFLDEEYKVVRVEEGKGNWAGAVKRFVCELPDGRTFEAGVRGSREALTALLETSWTPDWATVRYPNLTPGGVPRFGVVVNFGSGEREL